MGLWVTWASGRCLCPWQWGWKQMILKFLFNPNNSVSCDLQISISCKHLLPVTETHFPKANKRVINTKPLQDYYFHSLWIDTSSYFIILKYFIIEYQLNKSGKTDCSFQTKSLKDSDIWIQKIHLFWTGFIKFFLIGNWLLFSVHQEVWEYLTKYL